jgi:hypothetical protein
MGRLEQRRPSSPREEVPERDVGEELERRDEERDDDPDRRQDRDQGAKGEDDFDDVLAPAAAGGAQADCACSDLLCRQPTTPSCS